jgi:LemA protein
MPEEKKSHMGLWIVLSAIILVILGSIAWYFGTFNMLVNKQVAVDVQWSQVETVYQRRYDLIPNLVESVKGYLLYEKSTLTEITRLRSQWQTQTDTNEKVKTSNELETAISKLLVVMENYPNLKGDQEVTRLMDELAGTENRISVERMRYNDRVGEYNIAIRVFPNSIIANMNGFAPKELFKSEIGAEKNVKVNITV